MLDASLVTGKAYNTEDHADNPHSSRVDRQLYIVYGLNNSSHLWERRIVRFVGENLLRILVIENRGAIRVIVFQIVDRRFLNKMTSD